MNRNEQVIFAQRSKIADLEEKLRASDDVFVLIDTTNKRLHKELEEERKTRIAS